MMNATEGPRLCQNVHRGASFPSVSAFGARGRADTGSRGNAIDKCLERPLYKGLAVVVAPPHASGFRYAAHALSGPEDPFVGSLED